jgi:large subunit ribosomal protein L9
MKIFLLKDIPGIGKKYDIKTVSDGHAGNFLIPRGLAKQATAEDEKNLESLRATDQERRNGEEKHLIAFLDTLSANPIVFTEKANEKGHLFAAIHPERVAKALSERLGSSVDASLLKDSEPIKEVGMHDLSVKVGAATKKLPVQVIAAE